MFWTLEIIYFKIPHQFLPKISSKFHRKCRHILYIFVYKFTSMKKLIIIPDLILKDLQHLAVNEGKSLSKFITKVLENEVEKSQKNKSANGLK